MVVIPPGRHSRAQPTGEQKNALAGAVAGHLIGAGPDERIRYEVFGSEQWRPVPVPTPA